MSPPEHHVELPGLLRVLLLLGVMCPGWIPAPLSATPANKAALEKHYDRFLHKDLNRCTTCHLPSARKAPESLEEFPHNPFGNRLRVVGKERLPAGGKADLGARLAQIAAEDADGDGVGNQVELLLGHNPGDSADRPTPRELETAKAPQAEFTKFLAAYRWRPFETVAQPAVPKIKNRRWARNPVDVFIAAKQQEKNLVPRNEASRETLLRRVYFDLIGLSPTPEEQRVFLADRSARAFEKVVDRLLDDPRYGERWGRHWMDVWRYSDWAGWTDGGQVRDSKPHIWRWRDWIVESLNQDKPYDRMVVEMLAADEVAPEDTNALRATGFLVRNYKMLSREQWLEDTVKHTSQAFLGVTVGCAKCHDHMTDPISQEEYYRMRAIFEPHQVRTDKVPGQTNTVLDGLVRVFDVGTNAPTWLFHRGDERHPDTNRLIAPGVPAAFGGALQTRLVSLPRLAATPDKREFVISDTIRASEKAVMGAGQTLAKARTNAVIKADKLKEHELSIRVAESRHAALLAAIEVERLEDKGRKDSSEWTSAATNAVVRQRQLALDEAGLKLHLARGTVSEAASKVAEATVKTNGVDKATKELEAAEKKKGEAEKQFADAGKMLQADASTAFKARLTESYPATSTGRRLAFAQWIVDPRNPLTARVAVNHVWLRHFGKGLVPTPADFGRSGRAPSHPELLDWLAAEFVEQGWSMKTLHRLLVTSSAYRLASTPDSENAAIDPDNVFLWRMNSRRLEAEAVRDNLLYVSGSLDLTRGGPDIDNKLGLTSRRRSLYLRLAAEKEVEFLRIFDGPTVTECYERKPSVVPQQALALANSELGISMARQLAQTLAPENGKSSERWIEEAFRRVLARPPSRKELITCRDFLDDQARRIEVLLTREASPVGLKSKTASDPQQRARENLVLVLMNHNEFVTVR